MSAQAHLLLVETVGAVAVLGLGHHTFLPDVYLDNLVCPCLTLYVKRTIPEQLYSLHKAGCKYSAPAVGGNGQVVFHLLDSCIFHVVAGVESPFHSQQQSCQSGRPTHICSEETVGQPDHHCQDCGSCRTHCAPPAQPHGHRHYRQGAVSEEDNTHEQPGARYTHLLCAAISLRQPGDCFAILPRQNLTVAAISLCKDVISHKIDPRFPATLTRQCYAVAV